MKEYKIESSQFIKDLAKARKEADLPELNNNRVGNNGFTVGQKFVLNGELGIEYFQNGGRDIPYPVVYCEDGSSLNIRRLMGVSSLRGYQLQGEFIHQYDEEGAKVKAPGYEPSETKVYADCLTGITAEDIYHPKDDRFLHFLMDIEAGALPKGTVVTYLGTAVRPYVARRGSEETNAIEHWRAGYQRAMSTQLWKVELPKNEAAQ